MQAPLFVIASETCSYRSVKNFWGARFCLSGSRILYFATQMTISTSWSFVCSISQLVLLVYLHFKLLCLLLASASNTPPLYISFLFFIRSRFIIRCYFQTQAKVTTKNSDRSSVMAIKNNGPLSRKSTVIVFFFPRFIWIVPSCILLEILVKNTHGFKNIRQMDQVSRKKYFPRYFYSDERGNLRIPSGPQSLLVECKGTYMSSVVTPIRIVFDNSQFRVASRSDYYYLLHDFHRFSNAFLYILQLHL